MKNTAIPLEDCHLIVQTQIKNIKKYVKNFDLETMYKNLKINMGLHIYDIVLKPFYDNYHGSWVHSDLRRLKEDEDGDNEEEIYIIVTEPNNWNNFSYTISKINELSSDTNDLFDETDVSYINIPWTREMHRWD
jgi:hypothetical protein